MYVNKSQWMWCKLISMNVVYVNHHESDVIKSTFLTPQKGLKTRVASLLVSKSLYCNNYIIKTVWLHMRGCIWHHYFVLTCLGSVRPSSVNLYVLMFVFVKLIRFTCGPGSSVGIATELRVGRPAIESWWGRDFPPVQIGHGTNPASCTMGTGSFPGVEAVGACCWPTHPHPVPRS